MAQIAAETETDQAPLPQFGGLGKPAAKTITGEGPWGISKGIAH